jgi:nucleotide-binding universal stress UspA family protein
MPEGESQGLIVFGDDGSPAADLAWRWINEHAWARWRVEVVAATEPPLRPTEDEPELSEWDPTRPRHPETGAELGDVRHLTAAADPRILLGARHDADLLVVGTRGRTPLQSLLIGSTTEWLLHHPPAPLAVIASPGPVRQVLIATDGSSHSLAAIDAFAGLPWATSTTVVLLAVDDGRIDAPTAIGAGAERLAAAKISFGERVANGRPTAAITDVMGEINPELTVMGTRGLTGLTRLRLGSTAGAITRSGRTSVLVVATD